MGMKCIPLSPSLDLAWKDMSSNVCMAQSACATGRALLGQLGQQVSNVW